MEKRKFKPITKIKPKMKTTSITTYELEPALEQAIKMPTGAQIVKLQYDALKKLPVIVAIIDKEAQHELRYFRLVNNSTTLPSKDSYNYVDSLTIPSTQHLIHIFERVTI